MGILFFLKLCSTLGIDLNFTDMFRSPYNACITFTQGRLKFFVNAEWNFIFCSFTSSRARWACRPRWPGRTRLSVAGNYPVANRWTIASCVYKTNLFPILVGYKVQPQTSSCNRMKTVEIWLFQAMVQRCKLFRAFQVEFGLETEKISGLIRAWFVVGVLGRSRVETWPKLLKQRLDLKHQYDY